VPPCDQHFIPDIEVSVFFLVYIKKIYLPLKIKAVRIEATVEIEKAEWKAIIA